MAEAYALSDAIERGLRTRPAVADTKGQLNIRQTIDLSTLKQIIWNNHDDCDEEADGSKGE